MSLVLYDIFQVIGRAGRVNVQVNTAQSGQGATFNELVGEPYSNPAWTANLAQTYDSAIRSQTSGITNYIQAVQNIILGLVSEVSPPYGTSISSAWTYISNLMSQQNSASYTVSDGVTNGTTTITSATANFTTGVVGQMVEVSGGTAPVTAAWYLVVSRTNSTTIIVNTATGLTAGTGATLVIGGATVQLGTVGSSVTPFVTNTGTGSVFTTLIRGDGVSLQNTIPENDVLVITADSYTGGATLGQEPWSFSGCPNVSSLGTGVPVGQFDWDALTGSGVSVSGNAIAANQYANTSGNYLTNGDFANWTPQSTSPTAVLNNWNLVTGTYGTDCQQSTTTLGGTYSVEFLAGTGVLTTLTQQFGSSSSTGATAGTPTSLTNYQSYSGNFFLKAGGVISGGVLTISLVDGTNTVINDQSGTPNTTTITLSTVTTSWVAHTFNFRLPVKGPTTVRLLFKISTALTGAALYLDWVTFSQPIDLYVGGPSIALYSNPSTPFVAGPIADGWTVSFTNNIGGSTYWNSNMQQLVNSMFNIPELILTTSSMPTFPNTLITGA